MILPIIKAAVVALSLSADAFTAGFVYGCNKVKIPIVSVHIINIICSCALGLSFMVGTAVKHLIPERVAAVVCFAILFCIGLTKLLDSVTKSVIKKYNNFNTEFKFSLMNFGFIVNLYANPIDADVDLSKTISPTEAASLAVALSLDGIAVGLGAAFGDLNGLAIFILSLAANMLAIISGRYFGDKLACRAPFNITWIGGIILIILAVSKLL